MSTSPDNKHYHPIPHRRRDGIMTTTDDAGRDFSSFNCPSALDVIAKQAFDDYASKYDTESDEWQDKGSNEYFIAGFKAALIMVNENVDGILSQCTRNGITKPCEKCGHLTPVRMKDGNRFWIRCFMCQNDGTDAGTMEEAIQNWESDNAVYGES